MEIEVQNFTRSEKFFIYGVSDVKDTISSKYILSMISSTKLWDIKNDCIRIVRGLFEAEYINGYSGCGRFDRSDESIDMFTKSKNYTLSQEEIDMFIQYKKDRYRKLYELIENFKKLNPETLDVDFTNRNIF